MSVRFPRVRDGVLIEASRSGGPSGAVNQNNGEPIMGALHFTGAIWLAITKKQIALMTNKIRTEAMPSLVMGRNWCYFIVIESYWQHWTEKIIVSVLQGEE